MNGAGFLTMVGNSMEPTISRGDMIGYALTTRFTADDLYVVDYGCGPFCIRVQCFHTSELGHHLRLTYDEQVAGRRAYPPTTMSREQFSQVVLGRVFAICRVNDADLMRKAGVSFGMPDPLPSVPAIAAQQRRLIGARA